MSIIMPGALAKFLRKPQIEKIFRGAAIWLGGRPPQTPPGGFYVSIDVKRHFEKNVKKPKNHEKTRKYHQKSVFEIVFEKFSTIRVPVFYFSFGKFVLVGEKSGLRDFRKVPAPAVGGLGWRVGWKS